MNKLLVFQTDFTYLEGAIGAMIGVVKSVDSMLDITHATHQIPQYDIYSASYRLSQYVPFWPANTVFVSVVDPGVGTARKASVALLDSGQYIVTPDNGSLTHINNIVEIREIDIEKHRLRGKNSDEVMIFHGRDVFGYVAAKLACGQLSFEEVGEKYPLTDIIRFKQQAPYFDGKTFVGEIEIDDPNFGNLWSNIPISLLLENGVQFGDKLEVTIDHQQLIIPLVKAFGEVSQGQDLAYRNEINRLSFASCMANFEQKHQLQFKGNVKCSVRRIEHE